MFRTLAGKVVLLTAIAFLPNAAHAGLITVTNLGATNDVFGVTRLSNGTTLGVGNDAFGNAMLWTVARDGTFTTTNLGSLGGKSSARSISDNGDWIGGFSESPQSQTDLGSLGEGAIWQRSNPSAVTGTGFLLRDGIPFFESFVAGIANNGTAAGNSVGTIPMIWTPSGGAVGLPGPNPGVVPGAFANGISKDGSVAVGDFSDVPNHTLRGVFWDSSGFNILPDLGFGGGSLDISPTGNFIGGNVLTFDATHVFDQAAVWENGSLIPLLGSDGLPFEGLVRAVTDDGWAGGTSPQGAFIWHPTLLPNVMLFDDYLLSEFGTTLPTPALDIWDLHSDGRFLTAAVKGSAYVVSAEVAAVPEPSSFLLWAVGMLCLSAYRYRGEQLRTTRLVFRACSSQTQQMLRFLAGKVALMTVVLFLSYSAHAALAQSGATIVDLGSTNDVFGVTRLADGTTLAVGNDNTGTALLWTIAADGTVATQPLASLGGFTSARTISDNGDWIGGFSESPQSQIRPSVGEGAIWQRANPGVVTGTGFVLRENFPFFESIVFGIANNGTAAGQTAGGIPMTWTPSGGIVDLPGPTPGKVPFAGANGLSADGSVAVGDFTDQTTAILSGVFWDVNGINFLPDLGFGGGAIDISPSGNFIAGNVLTFDATHVFDQAAVWENGTLIALTDAANVPFEGLVRAVTDDGWAGGSSPQGAFIWHKSLGGVLLLDEFLFNSFDVALATNPSSIRDLHSDGVFLTAAVKGSAFTVTMQIGQPEDFNANGVVDDLDLAVWESGFGTATDATRTDGDADYDADVDGPDFLAWQRNLGGTSLLATQVSAVPEPSTFLLWEVGMLCMVVSQARRSR